MAVKIGYLAYFDYTDFRMPILQDSIGHIRGNFESSRAGHDMPLSYAKSLIIDAIGNFDRELGIRAEEILNDANRLNLQEVSDGNALMMRVRPAGLKPEDMMNLENSRLTPDEIDRLRKFFPDDANEDGTSAIIDYQYDGTMNAVIYLSHELGHAIADDLQRESGLTYRDNPSNISEIQAYFMQNIVYEELRKHSDRKIASAAESSFKKEVGAFIQSLHEGDQPDGTNARPQEFMIALGLLLKAGNMEMLNTLYGAGQAPSLEKTTAHAGFAAPTEIISHAIAVFSRHAEGSPAHAPAPVPRNAGLTN